MANTILRRIEFDQMTQWDAIHFLFDTQCQPPIEIHMFGVECATTPTS